MSGDRKALHRLAQAAFTPLPGSRAEAAPKRPAPIRASIVVRAPKPVAPAWNDPRWQLLPRERPPVSPAESRDRHCLLEDLRRVEEAAASAGLEVIGSSSEQRTVVVEGSRKAIEGFFGVELVWFDHPERPYRGHRGAPHVPAELAPLVERVVGLNDRPLARRLRPSTPGAAPGGRPFPATRLAQLYDFPRGFDGSGQVVGIVAMGGGYRRSDLAVFFGELGLAVPRIVDVPLLGAKNKPEPVKQVKARMDWFNTAISASGPTGPPPTDAASTVEVTMDIELIGALVPAAELRVYFTPDTEQGFMELMSALRVDGGPTVLSISWGWNEAEDDALQHHLGHLLDPIAWPAVPTVCAASGDFGSSGLLSADDASRSSRRRALHPMFPASHPYVTACGGTTIVTAGDVITSETVWAVPEFGLASGGGVSRLAPKPVWQRGLDLQTSGRPSGRGLPDLAAVADPNNHARIVAGGVAGPAAGTSAAAPICAALIARLNQALGLSLGYFNPLLYRLARETPDVVRNVPAPGSNGAYRARKGWDPCTGWGSPRGDRLLAALRG